MRLFRKRFLKLGNKGLSMVELLCAVAILGLLSTAVSSVMVVSANSYQRGNSETEVQQEAQLVANQISDLLIDSTADVTYASDVLTIQQGGKGYEVSYNSANHKLYYCQYDIGAGGAKLNTSDNQLMAENLLSFSVNVADFAETGNVLLKMKFKNNNQEYPAVFTVTARNKETNSSATPSAYLDVPSEVILEPNQSYTIVATVSGTVGAITNYSIVGATSASTTVNGTGGVTVGSDEMANMFRVKVSVTGGGTGTLLAEKYVNVYVRRVNVINVSGSLTAGVDGAAGAVYQLTAALDGTNFPRALGASYDDNYVDPAQIEWTVTNNSGGIGYSLTTGADNTRATLTLNGEMPVGADFTVTAVAKHPAGVNKMSTPYGSITDNFTLHKSMSPFNPPPADGWKRQSNEPQTTLNGQVDVLKAAYGGTSHKVQIRYREYPSGTFGGWLENIYGDANNSMTVNLRPLVTGALDYDKDYELQIQLIIMDAAGNQVWPVAGVTPENEYLLGSVVKRVGVYFDSSLLGLSMALQNDAASAPTLSLTKDTQYELLAYNTVQGIDVVGTAFTNNMRYILEKKDASGTWVPASAEMQNQNGKCMLTFRNADFAGEYRVKVKVVDMPNNTLQADGTLRENGRMEYILYDETTGQNIFYFNVG